MTDRDKFLQKKKKEIEKISKEQMRLSQKGVKLAQKTFKTQPARLRNLAKVIAIAALIKTLEGRKLLIASQPFHNFNPGCTMPSGLAMVPDIGQPEFTLHVTS